MDASTAITPIRLRSKASYNTNPNRRIAGDLRRTSGAIVATTGCVTYASYLFSGEQNAKWLWQSAPLLLARRRTCGLSG
jgi:hypothetical protein